MNIKSALVAATAGFLLAAPVSASGVFLVGDSNVFTTRGDNEIFFQNVFNSTSVLLTGAASLSGLGTTATTSTGSIDSTSLTGKDFLLVGYQKTAYTSGELSAISTFVNGGGSLFLTGEGNTGFTSTNTAVNSVLAALGSTMRLSLTSNLDASGYTDLTGLVTNTSFASGVNGWSTAYTASISLGANGQSIIGGIADRGLFGTAVGYESFGGSSTAVPLPAGLPLLATAVAGLGYLRRRNRKAA